MAELKYPRTGSQRRGDFAAAREFELTVSSWLGPFKIEHLDATDKMDFWVPGIFLDAKEKGQQVSGRWPLPEGCPPEEAFILDELSVRRAIEKGPSAYFVLHDRPRQRVYLARVDEICAGSHRRIDRVGSTDVKKGKWVIDLREYRRLDDPAHQLLPTILADQIALPWRVSACLIPERDL